MFVVAATATIRSNFSRSPRSRSVCASLPVRCEGGLRPAISSHTDLAESSGSQKRIYGRFWPYIVGVNGRAIESEIVN